MKQIIYSIFILLIVSCETNKKNHIGSTDDIDSIEEFYFPNLGVSKRCTTLVSGKAICEHFYENGATESISTYDNQELVISRLAFDMLGNVTDSLWFDRLHEFQYFKHFFENGTVLKKTFFLKNELKLIQEEIFFDIEKNIDSKRSEYQEIWITNDPIKLEVDSVKFDVLIHGNYGVDSTFLIVGNYDPSYNLIDSIGYRKYNLKNINENGLWFTPIKKEGINRMRFSVLCFGRNDGQKDDWGKIYNLFKDYVVLDK